MSTRVLPTPGKDIVVLSYTCENISTLTLRFFFDEDCEAVAIRMFDLVKFPESKLPTMLAAINQQNARFRFVKFVIDTNDHTVQAEADVAFRSHDVGISVWSMSPGASTSVTMPTRS